MRERRVGRSAKAPVMMMKHDSFSQPTIVRRPKTPTSGGPIFGLRAISKGLCFYLDEIWD
jgi:hypothetical protein